jgi:rubredoxin
MTAEILHKCLMCGHLHDEKKEGLWEDLSEEFKCPECYASKENYDSELWHSV